MDAKQVIEKILADANAEAGKIRKQADEAAIAENAKLDDQLKDDKKQTEILAQRAAEDKQNHMLAAARMEIAKELLAEKRAILDEVFEQAKSQLQNLPAEDYREIMAKLMIEAVESGDEEVIIDNNETRIDLEFIKQVNRRLGPGYKGNLRLSQQKQNLGAGFILRRQNIKNNVSLDVLLDQARQELEIELAGQIFKNQQIND